jgi:hypothetical protein
MPLPGYSGLIHDKVKHSTIMFVLYLVVKGSSKSRGQNVTMTTHLHLVPRSSIRFQNEVLTPKAKLP